MPTITIYHRFSAAGRKAHLLAGGDGNATRRVSVTPDDRMEWPRAVALADAPTGDAWDIHLQYSDDREWDTVPAIGELLDYKIARDAGRIAKRKACEAEEIAETEAIMAESLRLRRTEGKPGNLAPVCRYSNPRPLNYAAGREAELKTWNSPEWKSWTAEIDAANKAHHAAEKAAEDKAKAKEAAAVEAGKAKLAEWTRQHGGETAKLRLEEGLESWVSAAKEDYAESVWSIFGLDEAEVPDGYEFRRGNSGEKLSPSAAEIKALRAARAQAETLDPEGAMIDMELIHITYHSCDDATEDAPDRLSATEIRITLDVFGLGTKAQDFVCPA